MAEISKVYDYLIKEFISNPLVNTISTFETNLIDHNIKSIYPIVNLDLLDTEIENQIILLNFKITIVQQRDTIPKIMNSKIIGEDNLIDNLNETHAIACRFISVLENKDNLENIMMESKSKIEFLKASSINNLDGVQFDVILSVPNESYSC